MQTERIKAIQPFLLIYFLIYQTAAVSASEFAGIKAELSTQIENCAERLCLAGLNLDSVQAESMQESEKLNHGSQMKPGNNHYFVPYKENFIIFGRRYDNSSVNKDGKIQISIKHTLYDDGKKNKSRKEKFYMGFSYKSIWGAWEMSAPFEDHNFNLDLFYCSDNYNCDEINAYSPAKSQRHYLGLEHSSNGQGGPLSRSWDRVYARAMNWQGHHAYSAKIWWYRRISGNNSDAEEFLGFSEFEYRYNGNYHTSVKVNAGDNKGNMSIDWSKKSGDTATLYYFVQLFHGYGESLLTYNQKRTAIRAGIRLAN